LGTRWFLCAERSKSPSILAPSRLAKTPVLLRLPVIRPDSRDSVEQVVRVVLVLDLQQPRVIDPVIRLLPIWVLEVCLIEVGAPIRSQLSKLRHQNIGHQILVGKHILPRPREVPRRSDDGIDEVVAPRWVDSVVRVAGSRERGVGGDSDELGTLLVDETVSVRQRCSVVFYHGTRDQSAAVLCNTDLDGRKHRVEKGEVAVELAEEAGVLDVQLVEFVHQGCEDFFQLGDGDVGASQR
jgi:hypothetical protein